MKVVFLDFDGVIVTAHTRYKAGDPWCIHWLNDVVTRWRSCAYWRFHDAMGSRRPPTMQGVHREARE